MPTTLAPIAPAPVDLETRLALADAAMNVRLEQAGLAFEVNTAHLPAAEPILPGPLTPAPPAPAPAPAEYTTPIAAVLQRAITRLQEAGWCTGQYRDEQGALCLAGAIRAEAGGGSVAGAACQFLLEVIQQQFTAAETLPSWNDAQVGPEIPLRILGQAADQAAANGI
ncbi:DUF6197 family protein [Streptomyces lavendulocolor]|uniref:DUF6197 family protein n=1 Tax=Streptomyces lavendulocolor TaxID=67316 RepID=UPI003C2E0843